MPGITRQLRLRNAELGELENALHRGGVELGVDVIQDPHPYYEILYILDYSPFGSTVMFRSWQRRFTSLTSIVRWLSMGQPRGERVHDGGESN